MKIRNAFVSNSSSTSFIIKYDKSKFVKCPTCGHHPVTPEELIKYGDCSYDDAIRRYSLEECLEYYEDELEYGKQHGYDNEYTQAILDKLKLVQQNLKPTETVLAIELDNHGHNTQSLTELKKAGLVEIIDVDR